MNDYFITELKIVSIKNLPKIMAKIESNDVINNIKTEITCNVNLLKFYINDENDDTITFSDIIKGFKVTSNYECEVETL